MPKMSSFKRYIQKIGYFNPPNTNSWYWHQFAYDQDLNCFVYESGTENNNIFENPPDGYTPSEITPKTIYSQGIEVVLLRLNDAANLIDDDILSYCDEFDSIVAYKEMVIKRPTMY